MSGMTAAEHLMTISQNGQVSIPATTRARWLTRRVIVVDLGDRVVMRPAPEQDGIADLQAHLNEGYPGRLEKGVIAGHCDCMFMTNTYRWDFSKVAALVAPRPLMLGKMLFSIASWNVG